MKTRRAKRRDDEQFFSRELEVRAVGLRVYAHGEESRGLPARLEGSSYMDVRGVATEEVKGARDFAIQLHIQ